MITFGTYNSAKFRKALGIANDASKQAHHLVPRAKVIIEHEVVQRAAKADLNQGFHIDQISNGIPVDKWRNQPNHDLYNARISSKLEYFINQNPNAGSEDCYNELSRIINLARQAIINNPNVHLNNLIF